LKKLQSLWLTNTISYSGSLSQFDSHIGNRKSSSSNG